MIGDCSRCSHSLAYHAPLVGLRLSIALLDDPEDTGFLIYEAIDALMSAGDFAAVDAFLWEDWSRLSTLNLLAILSISEAARELLAERSGFAAKVREWLTTREPERVDELLRGLE